MTTPTGLFYLHNTYAVKKRGTDRPRDAQEVHTFWPTFLLHHLLLLILLLLLLLLVLVLLRFLPATGGCVLNHTLMKAEL